MKYSILVRKDEKDFCDVIIMGKDMQQFCAALKINQEKHGIFNAKPLTEIEFEANKIGGYYDVKIIMPNILTMKKEMSLGENYLSVTLTSSPKDRFHKLDGDLEKTLGLFTWPGIEYLDINELGRMLVKEGYLNPK